MCGRREENIAVVMFIDARLDRLRLDSFPIVSSRKEEKREENDLTVKNNRFGILPFSLPSSRLNDSNE